MQLNLNLDDDMICLDLDILFLVVVMTRLGINKSKDTSIFFAQCGISTNFNPKNIFLKTETIEHMKTFPPI